VGLWAEQGITGSPSFERRFCAVGDVNIGALAVAIDSRGITGTVIVNDEIVHLLVTVLLGFLISEIWPK
jgi:hypothetical protein